MLTRSAHCAWQVDKKRVVSAEEGEKYAKDRGLEYVLLLSFSAAATASACMTRILLTLLPAVLARPHCYQVL